MIDCCCCSTFNLITWAIDCDCGAHNSSVVLEVGLLARIIGDIRAVYTRENKPLLTLAAAYIRRERNHLYEYGLY